ncbi:MAG: RING-H2 finger protein [Puia sp.]|nr:RING-H2 finger protein [Puia sp.]
MATALYQRIDDQPVFVSSSRPTEYRVTYFAPRPIHHLNTKWKTRRIAVAPFKHLASLLHYENHPGTYIFLQSVPTVVYFVASLFGCDFCSDPVLLAPMIIAAIFAVTPAVAICAPRTKLCPGPYVYMIIGITAWILHGVLIIAIPCIVLVIWGSTAAEFVVGFVLVSVVTVPGLCIVFAAMFVAVGCVETLYRLFTCSICGDTTVPPEERTESYIVAPVKFSELGLMYVTCMICMEGIEPDEDVVRMTCDGKHVVHANCFLRRGEDIFTCPVCTCKAPGKANNL